MIDSSGSYKLPPDPAGKAVETSGAVPPGI